MPYSTPRPYLCVPSDVVAVRRDDRRQFGAVARTPECAIPPTHDFALGVRGLAQRREVDEVGPLLRGERAREELRGNFAVGLVWWRW